MRVQTADDLLVSVDVHRLQRHTPAVSLSSVLQQLLR